LIPMQAQITARQALTERITTLITRIRPISNLYNLAGKGRIALSRESVYLFLVKRIIWQIKETITRC
jgi:hypothetical protein